MSIYPWEISIEPPREEAHGSARNHVLAEIVSITTLGNRVRLGLAGPQPLAAEITRVSADQLHLRPGATVTASWKAAATRLVANSPGTASSGRR